MAKRIAAAVLLLLILVPNLSPAGFNRFPRPSDGSGGPTCRLVPTLYPTIQRAIDAAFDGDTVLVDDEVYTESIRFRGKAITLASMYILDGDTNHIAGAIIKGGKFSSPDSASVVYFIDGEDTNSVLCGLTITGGRGTMHRYDFPTQSAWYRLGGGVYCDGAGPRIMRNIIKDNSCVDSLAGAGGINVFSLDTATYTIIEDNLIVDNHVHSYAGDQTWVSKGGGASVRVSARICGNRFERNVLFSTQSSCQGGGLVFGRKSPSGLGPFPSGLIRNNVFRDNECGYSETWGHSGGGLSLQSVSETMVEGNLVEDNHSAHAGGGIEVNNFGAPSSFLVSLRNNIVARNVSGRGYGSVAISLAGVSLINNTIVQNSGSGVTTFGDANVVLVNNIIWGNNGPSLDPQYGTPSLSCHFNNMQEWWPGTGNISVDPGFVGGMYWLSDSSACIGAGTDTLEIEGTVFRAPPTDIDGMARPIPAGSRPDLGAKENALAIGVNMPFVVLSHGQHDFLNVWPGASSDTLALAVQNRVNVPVVVLSMALARPEFRIVQPPAMPVTLAAYEQASIHVIFCPTVPGVVLHDTLVLQTSDPRRPEIRVALAGRGGSPAICARQGVLYGISDDVAAGLALYAIEKGDGQAIRLAGFSARPEGAFGAVALNPLDSMMYAAFTTGKKTGIFKLSSEMGDVEPVATIAIGELCSMSFRPDGTVFFMTSDGSLYSQISWESSPTRVGAPGYAFTGLAFNPATGALWATLHDTVFTVDPGSGEASAIGWGQGGIPRSTIAFNKLGVLYGLYGTALVTVGTVRGDWQTIGTTGVQDLKAIALRNDVVTGEEATPGPGLTWKLEQNYPNPFNPVTMIRYEVGGDGGAGWREVRLVVYDLLGRIVSELVNERQSAGKYDVPFDATGLSSGFYIYRLTAGSFAESKRMMLIK